jgi:hypothetical protein
VQVNLPGGSDHGELNASELHEVVELAARDQGVDLAPLGSGVKAAGKA